MRDSGLARLGRAISPHGDGLPLNEFHCRRVYEEPYLYNHNPQSMPPTNRIYDQVYIDHQTGPKARGEESRQSLGTSAPEQPATFGRTAEAGIASPNPDTYAIYKPFLPSGDVYNSAPRFFSANRHSRTSKAADSGDYASAPSYRDLRTPATWEDFKSFLTMTYGENQVQEELFIWFQDAAQRYSTSALPGVLMKALDMSRKSWRQACVVDTPFRASSRSRPRGDTYEAWTDAADHGPSRESYPYVRDDYEYVTRTGGFIEAPPHQRRQSLVRHTPAAPRDYVDAPQIPSDAMHRPSSRLRSRPQTMEHISTSDNSEPVSSRVRSRITAEHQSRTAPRELSLVDRRQGLHTMEDVAQLNAESLAKAKVNAVNGTSPILGPTTTPTIASAIQVPCIESDKVECTLLQDLTVHDYDGTTIEANLLEMAGPPNRLWILNRLPFDRVIEWWVTWSDLFIQKQPQKIPTLLEASGFVDTSIPLEIGVVLYKENPELESMPISHERRRSIHEYATGSLSGVCTVLRFGPEHIEFILVQKFNKSFNSHTQIKLLCQVKVVCYIPLTDVPDPDATKLDFNHPQKNASWLKGKTFIMFPEEPVMPIFNVTNAPEGAMILIVGLNG